MLDQARCAVFCFMGGGKTSATLMLIDCLQVSGHVNQALILAPLRVARDTWPEEAKKWNQFAHLRIVFAGDDWLPAERAFLRAWKGAERLAPGDPKRRTAIADWKRLRAAALTSFLARIAGADAVTINYDRIRELVAILGDQWPFGMVVCDESTRVKSFRLQQGGKRAQALGKVAHTRVKRWVNLTGTPAPNGLEDLWGQTWFLDRGQRLGNTYSAFMDRWFGFRRKQDAVNPDSAYVERIVFPHSQAEIQGLLKDICLTLDPKDWFDLAEPIVNTLYVELPERARKHYREMEKELFTAIEGNPIEALGQGPKMQKCLQMANGAVYMDDGKWVEVHDEKLDALESVIEEANGAPVLVAYAFKHDKARIMKRFPHAIDIATTAGLKRAKAGQGRVWVAHPASLGHGVDGLQEHCNTAVFFGLTFNLENQLQMVERIGPVRQKQAGKDRPVHLHYILAARTVDEVARARMDAKNDLQWSFMDSLNRYKEQRA